MTQQGTGTKDQVTAAAAAKPAVRRVESYILIATGEGADARIVSDLDGGLHKFMCVCPARSIDECGDEMIRDVRDNMADVDNWSRDEAGERFQFNYEFEISHLTITRMLRDVPQIPEPSIGVGQIGLFREEFEAIRTDNAKPVKDRLRASKLADLLDELIERRRKEAQSNG